MSGPKLRVIAKFGDGPVPTVQLLVDGKPVLSHLLLQKFGVQIDAKDSLPVVTLSFPVDEVEIDGLMDLVEPKVVQYRQQKSLHGRPATEDLAELKVKCYLLSAVTDLSIYDVRDDRFFVGKFFEKIEVTAVDTAANRNLLRVMTGTLQTASLKLSVKWLPN